MDAIQESLSKLQDMFIQPMEMYQGELQAAAPSANISNLSSEFASFRQFIITSLRNLQNQVNLLAQQTDNWEMHSRRKILLLHGLPEQKNEDYTTAVAVQVVVDRMKISGFSLEDVSRCHRMGRSTNGKSRPILLKLCELATKHKVWYVKKTLKGTGMALSEFLTKTRQDVFMVARQNFRVTKCWTHGGLVYILGAGGVRQRISSLTELHKIDTPQVTKTTTVAKEVAGPPKGRRAGNSNKK